MRRVMYEINGRIEGEQVIPDGGVGAARCGVKFNPDGNANVDRLKTLAAAFMEACGKLQAAADDGDAKRCFATAMTNMESAQMFAVKGLFTKRNANA